MIDENKVVDYFVAEMETTVQIVVNDANDDIEPEGDDGS